MHVLKQKKFLYIPILNFIVIMISWLLFYYKNDVPKIRFVKNIIKIFVVCFIITIPRIFVDKITDIILIENFLTLIYTLIYLFVPSFFAIKDQIKYIEEQDM